MGLKEEVPSLNCLAPSFVSSGALQEGITFQTAPRAPQYQPGSVPCPGLHLYLSEVLLDWLLFGVLTG